MVFPFQQFYDIGNCMKMFDKLNRSAEATSDGDGLRINALLTNAQQPQAGWTPGHLPE